MPRILAPTAPEIFLTTPETGVQISRAVKRGEMQKLGPRLYTTRTDVPASDVLRQHWMRVVSLYFPGAVISARTALEGKPAADGSIFLTASKKKDVELDGLHVRAMPGPDDLPGDMPAPGGIVWASRARALLEVARPSRARNSVARGFRREELETWLERQLRLGGEDELGRLRDEMRGLALSREGASPLLPDAQDAWAVVDGIIGTLLGTRTVPVSAPTARARVHGTPYDPDCIARVQRLHETLVATPLPAIRDPAPMGRAARNLAFMDAYFSNYIEGTEFRIGEAREIVFEAKVIAGRAADTHDIRGTFELVSDTTFLKAGSRVWSTYEVFETVLKTANRRVMAGRAEKSPGQFKHVENHAGNTAFVQPDLVPGTLREGYPLVRALESPLARAIALMFLITDVHPFGDGNGRVARAFMNAELVSAGLCRILIPTVYRDDYVGALRRLTRQDDPTVLIEALQYAQSVTGQIDYADLDETIIQLSAWHAFDEPREGTRLRKSRAARKTGTGD